MEARITALLRRADEVRKAGAGRPDPRAVADQVLTLLEEARALLPQVPDTALRLDLAGQVARRVGDLDREGLSAMLAPSPDVARAPTQLEDPTRVPPGQHLTPGWPVLHVGRAPDLDRSTWRFTVTGRVTRRLVLGFDDLTALPTVRLTRDFHCVTGWSRLDNTWTGVRVADLLDQAGGRPEATHAIVSGHPAYSANLSLAVLREPDVLLAWEHDGAPLSTEHGGPVRLVVPSRYGWKSVKWATELRLTERDVPGYWEERGYHLAGDPWHEQRFRGD
jgi:DMSO/TMAO reductase YedYZ molybdopterin-dependent catalytic subunit